MGPIKVVLVGGIQPVLMEYSPFRWNTARLEILWVEVSSVGFAVVAH
jgi:hypothetical protein